MKTGRQVRSSGLVPWLTATLLCVLAGHVPAHRIVAAATVAQGALSNNQADTPSAIFVPVILTTAGHNNSFFTSELTLTNRGSEPAILNYTYTPHRGNKSYTATDRLGPLQQKIKSDAIGYLRGLEAPIPETGSQIGTLRVDVTGSSEVAAVVRTTTVVPEGRAGLAYPGIPGHEGFRDEAVYLCGLRQNRQDRSNVALQNMGTEGEITLRTTVFSGDAADMGGRRLDDRTLKPGGFYQHNEVLKELGSPAQGYVKVERVDGEAPFYAYGVINDQANSDGSFVFPVGESSLAGAMGQTLPVVIEVGPFTSELTVTNFSEEAKAVSFSMVADAIETADNTATFTVPLAAGQQHIIPNAIDTARRQFGLNLPRGLAAPLFARAVGTDMSGIVIGARTGSPADPEDSRRGQYSVFYTAVPRRAGFTGSAWVDGLQQNEENRSNLALVNTGEVDDGDIVFTLEIYDGETARLVNTVSNADTTVAAKRWHQINGILRKYGKGATQGFVRITKRSGDNPFLAYGVVNDGGVPRQRSDDGAYLPAVEERIHDPGTRRMMDREVLEVFYHATGGPGWTHRTNWLSDAHLSDWFGVETDSGGRVTALVLTHNVLSGTIPPELAQLTQLQGLRLDKNGLSGTIPPELGKLARLRALSIETNRLSGGIPPELGRLSQLQHLDLQKNGLSGVIPPELGRLTQLRVLSLNSNRLTGTIPSELAGLPQLVWLMLGDNQLTGAIPPGLGRLTRLRILDLGSNRLSGAIPPPLGKLTNLKWLDLGGNELSGAIPPQLAGLTKLEQLSIWGNELRGAIPKTLQQLSNLEWFDFVNTGICVPADTAFQAWLNMIRPFDSSRLVCDGTRRVSFSASGYEVTEGETVTVSVRLIDHTGDADWSAEIALTARPDGGAAAADYAGVPERVTITAPATEASFGVMALEDAPFDPGETVVLGFRRPLPAGLIAGSPDTATVTIHDPTTEGLTSREVLEALYHATGGPGWRNRTHWLSEAPLSEWFGVETDGNGRVTSLDLSNNELSGTIPSALGELPQLQSLNLRQNQMSGEIPPELGKLTNLQSLDLGGNRLSGGIPPELGGLIHLQELRLGSNALSERIPPELGGLNNLLLLDLVHNQLSGGIPSELGELTSLQSLEIKFNQLDGSIPPELGGLTNLQSLDLEFNQLDGSIPPELGGLIHLQELRLGSNALSERIPPELGGLNNLLLLDLVHNQLSGGIPSELGGLRNLRRLEISGNELSGEIPSGLGGLIHLQSLQLGGNALSGSIPPELGGLNNLQALALGSNQLSGGIPPELGGLIHLQWMNLGGNALSGGIPSELGGLNNLQALELSGNRLSGAIPPELAQMTTLEHLELGFNPNLTGTIPPGLQRLPLSILNLMATSVCVPEDAELQEWLATIEFSTSGLTCGRPPDEMSAIDIMVVYTPAARRLNGGTSAIEAMIDLWIAETNQIYVDSGANQRLFLVAREEVDYFEAGGSSLALERLENPSDGYMDEIHAIRDRAGADLVHFIADTFPSTADLAGPFGLTCAGCNSWTFAHELGHNMGLNHDRYDSPFSSTFAFSHGYVNQRAFAEGAPESARWRTIMAYSEQCVIAGGFSCDGVRRFSNPNQTYRGDPLGIPGDERTTALDGPADAVRTLNLMRHSVSGFRPRASGSQLTMSSHFSQARSMVKTGWAGAQSPDGDLFRAMAPSGRKAASRRSASALDRATLRQRAVSVDIGRLARVAEGESTALGLNLFDDVLLTGIIERRTPTYSGGVALSGRLVGVAEGSVTLVVNGSIVAGTVRMPGATYRIRPVGSGRHAIMQIDPSQLPQGCGVVTRKPGPERSEELTGTVLDGPIDSRSERIR